MKTVLDIIGEYAMLNDAKVRWGGKLPPGANHRWMELKSFYDLLMEQSQELPPSGVDEYDASPWSIRRGDSQTLTRREILRSIPRRRRLRVPVNFDVLLRTGDNFYTVRLRNVSRGGVFLQSPLTLPIDCPLTLVVAPPEKRDSELLEAKSEIVWSSGESLVSPTDPRGMGLRFIANDQRFEERMDRIVVECLERNLSNLSGDLLAMDSIPTVLRSN